MKLLFVYYTHKRGGLCTRLYRAMNSCVSHGAITLYLTLDPLPEGLLPQIQVKLIPFPLRRRKGLLFWALFTVWLPLYLVIFGIRHRPDRLVAFGAYYSAALSPLGLLTKTRLVLFLRSLTFKNDRLLKKNGLILKVSGLVDRYGMRCANKVICMTESMQREAESFALTAFVEKAIIPNDIPLVRSHIGNVPAALVTLKARAKVVLATSGVVDLRKNIGVLISAMARLDSETFSLVVIGEGRELPQLQKRVADSNLQSVHFTGWIENPESYLSPVNLYLHPSIHEGVSNSLLEALALGLPILLSDIPEHREIFAPYSAPLVDPYDPEAWGDAIERFAQDPAFAAELRMISKDICRRLTFDWDSAVYEALL